MSKAETPIIPRWPTCFYTAHTHTHTCTHTCIFCKNPESI